MNTTHISQEQFQPSNPQAAHAHEPVDTQFSDHELERALKVVGCNPQDLEQYLRSARAQ